MCRKAEAGLYSPLANEALGYWSCINIPKEVGTSQTALDGLGYTWSCPLRGVAMYSRSRTMNGYSLLFKKQK